MTNVLIVDDDVYQREVLVSALSDEYQVHTADGGWDAIRVLRREPINVILLDLCMDEGDGFTVLGHLMGTAHRPPVIVLSVRNEVKTVVTAMKLGAINYIVKPCTAEDARDAIRKVLPQLTCPQPAGASAGL